MSDGRASDGRASDAEARTLSWVRETVVGLELCPFAAGPLTRGEVRVVVHDGDDFDGCVRAALAEVSYLDVTPAVETTLVVFSRGLAALDALLDAAAALDALLERAGFSGVIQVVAFHPRFHFEGEAPDDLAAFTNRSPHPTLHLLREASVGVAVEAHPDSVSIPARNAARLRAMPRAELERRRDEPR